MSEISIVCWISVESERIINLFVSLWMYPSKQIEPNEYYHTFCIHFTATWFLMMAAVFFLYVCKQSYIYVHNIHSTCRTNANVSFANEFTFAKLIFIKIASQNEKCSFPAAINVRIKRIIYEIQFHPKLKRVPCNNEVVETGVNIKKEPVIRRSNSRTRVVLSWNPLSRTTLKGFNFLSAKWKSISLISAGRRRRRVDSFRCSSCQIK